MTVRIHPTAIVEQGVSLGEGTSVWDAAHIRHGTTLGDECIVGGKSYIAYDVQIGHRVKINSLVYICTAVTIEDGVMISAGVVFTNDRFPRAASNDLSTLRGSDPDEATRPTLVREGATIGAGAVIGCDLTIGRFAMVGMGSVVTRGVADFHLVVGNPARSIGAVCRCGEPLVKWEELPEDRWIREGEAPAEPCIAVKCASCDLQYDITGKHVAEFAKNSVTNVGRICNPS